MSEGEPDSILVPAHAVAHHAAMLKWNPDTKKLEGTAECDPEQYAMIKRCSGRKDATEWNAWREVNPMVEIWLQKADFRGLVLEGMNFISAHCEGANFWKASCKGADFFEAHCAMALFDVANCEKATFQCANCENTSFLQANCAGANFLRTNCVGANFSRACCKGTVFKWAQCKAAKFARAHCKGAMFRRAHCEEAKFGHADCEEADFRLAHCEGANFWEVNSKGARFSQSFLNEKTTFERNSINEETDFRLTALSAVRIDPRKRALLEHNIRRFEWADWYKTQPFFKNWPVQLFWWLSDYGYSTSRILKCFAALVAAFTLVYMSWPGLVAISSHIPDGNTSYICEHWPWADWAAWLGRLPTAFTFALSTMVTLGFSNINVAVENGRANVAGLAVVSLNLMVGYFMLAVLVTRMAVLFQTMGPGEPKVSMPRGDSARES